jgi:hypothetical protein
VRRGEGEDGRRGRGGSNVLNNGGEEVRRSSEGTGDGIEGGDVGGVYVSGGLS